MRLRNRPIHLGYVTLDLQLRCEGGTRLPKKTSRAGQGVSMAVYGRPKGHPVKLRRSLRDEEAEEVVRDFSWQSLPTADTLADLSPQRRVLFAIAKYVLKKDIGLNEVITAQGLIVSAVYIALTALAVRPFQCIGNPDGTSSMASYRNVVCWQDPAHSGMVALSVVPFFGGVCSFMALIVWAVIQYPYKVASPGGVKFVKRYNFIFSRFNPEAYFFALILNFRNFLIGILPILLVAYNELQFLSLTMTVADACLALFLMLVIVVGSMLLDFDTSRGTAVIQMILIVGMVLAGIGLVLVFSWAVYRAYHPSRTYGHLAKVTPTGIFLSHHKLGAAVLSRWFKMLLAEITPARVFLDSDDVSKLDAIIDVTAWDSENVVVLMTSETLKRMWCAAEIASAWAASTNIVLVSCDGNGFSQELLEMLPSLWTEEQQATLQNAGPEYHGNIINNGNIAMGSG
eukprot:s1178_g2.t1